MENDDARIIAIALGIPSATLVSIALILAVRFRYRTRQLQRHRQEEEHRTTPSVITDNSNGIPLEQQPPRLFAPIPRRPIPIHQFTGQPVNEEEVDVSESTPTALTEGSPTTTARRSPARVDITSDHPAAYYASLVPRTPPSGSDPRANPGRRRDMGRNTRPVATTDTPTPAAGVTTSELWDNLEIPYSAYFPQTGKPTLEPVQVSEPVAGPSNPRRSGWRAQPRRSALRPPRAGAWEQLQQRLRERPQPPPELTRPPEGSSGSTTVGRPTRPPTPFPRITIDGIPESTSEQTREQSPYYPSEDDTN